MRSRSVAVEDFGDRHDADGRGALAAPTARPRLAIGGDVAHRSHAKHLQSELAAAFEFQPEIEQKWPPAATLLFAVGTCGLFWMALATVLFA